MQNILETLLAPQNAALSVVMLFVMFYWVSVIVLGIGVEILDGLTGLVDHGHADPTTGLDTHIDGSGADVPLLTSALRFFNFGEVPATIILTVIIAIMWASNLVLYASVKGLPGPVQAAIVAGTFIAALFISKPITSPLKDLFNSKDTKGPQRTNLIGCDCIITVPTTETQQGQAEAKTPGNRFLVVSVRSAPGQGAIPKGARGIIVSVDPTAGGFLVRLPGSESSISEGGNSK